MDSCPHSVFTKTGPGRLKTTVKYDDWTCTECGHTKEEIRRRRNG